MSEKGVPCVCGKRKKAKEEVLSVCGKRKKAKEEKKNCETKEGETAKEKRGRMILSKCEASVGRKVGSPPHAR